MKLRWGYLFGLGLLMAMLLVPPAGATEGGLLGIPMGATPRNLMESYGYPAGVIFSTGSGLSLNTMRGGIMEPVAGNNPPAWAKAVWPSRLDIDQQMWIYQLKNELVAGFIIKGTGDAAAVTDIIAASFIANTKVKTEGGVSLGASLSKILLNYGYPPIIQPFAIAGAVKATATRTAAANSLRAGGNIPNFNRPDLRSGTSESPAVNSRGVGPVPPMGSDTSTSIATGSRVVVVEQRPISFTRNCVILYNGLAFTLYDFKVVRIHITQ